MENPSFQKKKPYTKPFFAPDFGLALMVSERVLERQFQGLFESGPKNWTYNLKIRAKYAQMYLKIHNFHFRGHLRQVQQVKLVNKIDEDRFTNKIDTQTKAQKSLK